MATITKARAAFRLKQEAQSRRFPKSYLFSSCILMEVAILRPISHRQISKTTLQNTHQESSPFPPYQWNQIWKSLANLPVPNANAEPD